MTHRQNNINRTDFDSATTAATTHCHGHFIVLLLFKYSWQLLYSLLHIDLFSLQFAKFVSAISSDRRHLLYCILHWFFSTSVSFMHALRHSISRSLYSSLSLSISSSLFASHFTVCFLRFLFSVWQVSYIVFFKC